jgi:very-short-patch-repair endonuclease
MGRPRDEQRRRERQEAFLAAFARTGIIINAAQESGILTGHYKWMKDDEEYATRFRQLQRDTAILAVETRKPGGIKPGFHYPEWHSKVQRRREQQDRLIAAVQEHKLLGKAITVSGVPYSTHYAWLQNDAEYAGRYNAMLEDIKAARKIAYQQGAFTANARREMTYHEKIVDDALRQLGVVFSPQDAGNGRYALDFYVPAAHLDIEVDSHMHISGTQYRQDDAERDAFLTRKGYRIHRIPHATIDDGSYIPALRQTLGLA